MQKALTQRNRCRIVDELVLLIVRELQLTEKKNMKNKNKRRRNMETSVDAFFTTARARAEVR